MNGGAFFQDLAILMTIAGVVAAVFSRFGWPKVLGYIAAGILMNAHTWGGSFLQEEQSVQTIGQLGVVFLMFAMGLSFSPREMKKIRHVALPAAAVDTVVMIWLGYILGTRAFGWGDVPSLFLGVAICDSATTLLAKVIDEMGWGKRPFAAYVLGTSVCEDIVCVGAIAVATGFAHGGGMSFSAFAASLGGLALFFLAVLVFGFVLVPRLLVSLGKRRDGEALLLTLLGICFFISFLAQRFDFSLALGAFLVGIVAASCNYRERIAQMVEPLKAMFAAVFFVSIGLLVDPVALGRCLPQILLVSLVIVVGKTANVTLASLAAGVDVKTAVQNGFGLAQIGEFAFMVAILYAGIAGQGPNDMFPIAVGASLLTTLLNPVLIRASDPLGDWAERHLPRRLMAIHENYCGWLAKILAAKGSPSFLLLRAALIRLGVYAALLAAVGTACKFLPRLDYGRFSTLFEQYDAIVFFAFFNVFAVALLPLIGSSARVIGDEISVLLTGEGQARWQFAVRQLTRHIAMIAVVILYFIEWTMNNLAIAPHGLVAWIVVGVLLVLAVVGWQSITRLARRATLRFNESLTADERREGLEKTTTVSVPEGLFQYLTIPEGSSAVGGTLATLNVRARTGASVLSVRRHGTLTRNVGADWCFRPGDTVMAMGSTEQIAALRDLLGVTA